MSHLIASNNSVYRDVWLQVSGGKGGLRLTIEYGHALMLASDVADGQMQTKYLEDV
jgi:hypothetical protein